MNRYRRLLLILSAALLPFVLLLLIEGGLRLAGVARERRLPFIEVPGQADFRVLNPHYIRRYFPAFVPEVAFEPFRAEKAAGTYRIFVLGESSAAGFPYHFYYAFPARLESRLAAALPDQRVEVINLGLTAVNSYALRDLAGAVVAQRPDAVVIYTGHNEYYGAFGVASRFGRLGDRPALKRLVLWLKRSVLYTLLEDALTAEPEQPEDRTMMARVVRDATIAYGGDVYRSGIEQFDANMAAVLATFREAGVPVYLGTLTSNLKDQPPLGDAPAAQQAYRQGIERLARGDSAGARAAFVEARDHDDIRFRAPSAINEKIRVLARRPGVTLVDVEDAFRRAAAGGVEGDALFDDHLHPNDRGYERLADAFFRAMQPNAAGAPAPPLPLDSFEQAHARLQIARLKEGFPFRKQASPEEEARAVDRLLKEALQTGRYGDSLAVVALTGGMKTVSALGAAILAARSQADTLDALLLYRSLLSWQPFNTALAEQALSFGLGTERFDATTGEVARLAAAYQPSEFALNALAVVRLRQGRIGEAAAPLDAVEALNPASPVMLYNKARLLVLQGDTLGARRYFERYRAVAGPN